MKLEDRPSTPTVVYVFFEIPEWLGGDEKLPGYVGIILSHENFGFLLKSQDSMESKRFFFSWLILPFPVALRSLFCGKLLCWQNRRGEVPEKNPPKSLAGCEFVATWFELLGKMVQFFSVSTSRLCFHTFYSHPTWVYR